MKVAALIPFRNEEKILSCCLSSLKGVADMVIGMNDHSSDRSADIFRSYGGIVLTTEGEYSGFSQGKEKIIRQRLLEEARRRGASHFLCLDADEALTTPFRKYGRELIAQLEPGHKLSLRWLTLWGSHSFFRDGDYSKFHRIYRAIIVCDSSSLPSYEGFLHMARTPGSDAKNNIIKCPLEKGAILHFTALDMFSYQMKIAWYHCIELVRTPKDIERINRFYFRDWDETHLKLQTIPEAWIDGLPLPEPSSTALTWQWMELQRIFNEKGIEFFEPLEIWHIPFLREEFQRRTGRFPKEPAFFTRSCRQ